MAMTDDVLKLQQDLWNAREEAVMGRDRARIAEATIEGLREEVVLRGEHRDYWRDRAEKAEAKLAGRESRC